jgi:hypothetical protein
MLAMKLSHFINTKKNPFFLIMLLCGVLFGGCASLSNKK